MSVYVFLGPSLAREEAAAILDATYLPPVAMGDLYALVKGQARGGDIVGIVDGLFEQVPAVWHKEVLYALSRGVRVFGAASMGALRAAELHPFGMVGVGRIFEAYRTGEIEDDDEVVVVHAPADRGYRSVSEAMVNVRWGLERAEAQGIITPGTRAGLVRVAKSQFYAERTWDSVLADGLAQGLPAGEIDALRRFVRSERPDAKGDDARALLRRLGQEAAAADPAGAAEAPGLPDPGFILEETTYWVGLTRARAGAVKPATMSASGGPGDPGGAWAPAPAAGVAPAAPAAPAAIVNHLRATSPERGDLWRHGLLLRLIAELGASLPITRDEVQATTLRFCRRHGIRSHAGLDEWRVQQRMSKEELAYLIELETRHDVLLRKHGSEIDDYVLLELKRRGRFADTANTIASKWRNLERLGIAKPTLEDAGIGADELQRWYESRCGRMTPSPEKHVEELGFQSLRDFVTELIALYMLERQQSEE